MTEKMTCALTQHSSWSRKHHPFSLHKRKRGDSAKKYATHKFQNLDNNVHASYYEPSKYKFNLEHQNQCDESNVENIVNDVTKRILEQRP